jgi:hypothetical protein
MGRRVKDRLYKGPARNADPGGEDSPQKSAAARTPKVKGANPLPQGKRLLTRIKEILNEKSKLPDGRRSTRFDDCAEAFVNAMEQGSFIHMKEFIDRQEGKVPNRVADADGGKIKMYIGVPLEGDEAP